MFPSTFAANVIKDYVNKSLALIDTTTTITHSKTFINYITLFVGPFPIGINAQQGLTAVFTQHLTLTLWPPIIQQILFSVNIFAQVLMRKTSISFFPVSQSSKLVCTVLTEFAPLVIPASMQEMDSAKASYEIHHQETGVHSSKSCTSQRYILHLSIFECGILEICQQPWWTHPSK